MHESHPMSPSALAPRRRAHELDDTTSAEKPVAKRIALCAAFAIAAFSLVASEAGEVRIGDFVFGCKTSDRQVRKPQFGDMNGVFYTEIRGQEKACEAAVKRMIANCHQHTRFLNPGDNEKYRECLPVFDEQAGECAAFFREEIAKCRGDGPAPNRQQPRTWF